MNFTKLQYIAEYPRYAATPAGEIYSFHRDRYLVQVKKPNGYMCVSLSKKGVVKQLMTHRIIASLFCEKPPGCNQVNHKDGIKWNNDYTNLEWVTAKQNNDHAIATGLKTPGYIGPGEENPAHILTEDDVEVIIKLRQEGKTYKKTSELTGVNLSTIAQILSGNTWHHVSKRLGYKPTTGFKKHL